MHCQNKNRPIPEAFRDSVVERCCENVYMSFWRPCDNIFSLKCLWDILITNFTVNISDNVPGPLAPKVWETNSSNGGVSLADSGTQCDRVEHRPSIKQVIILRVLIRQKSYLCTSLASLHLWNLKQRRVFGIFKDLETSCKKNAICLFAQFLRWILWRDLRRSQWNCKLLNNPVLLCNFCLCRSFNWSVPAGVGHQAHQRITGSNGFDRISQRNHPEPP
jgi:hypothetical protein